VTPMTGAPYPTVTVTGASLEETDCFVSVCDLLVCCILRLNCFQFRLVESSLFIENEEKVLML
jgi:hypothetical protein